MGRKWGSNEGIHIGDIFKCVWELGTWYREEYYQVVALRGRTQVVLHAVHSETYINEGIAEDSSLRRERTRPLPGQFMRADEMPEVPPIRMYEKQGKLILDAGERVTAWVSLERMPTGRLLLREVGNLGCYFIQGKPRDWELWDAETIQKLEEYAHQADEVLRRHDKGETDVPWPEYPL